jgi:hypothetical protein
MFSIASLICLALRTLLNELISVSFNHKTPEFVGVLGMSPSDAGLASSYIKVGIPIATEALTIVEIQHSVGGCPQQKITCVNNRWVPRLAQAWKLKALPLANDYLRFMQIEQVVFGLPNVPME